jgi:hypothetical protein
MGAESSRNYSIDLNTGSKAWSLVVAGYSTAAAGLVVFLTINGASGIPTAATIGTAGLIVIGLLLPATGILLMRRVLDPTERAVKYGFAMQAFGLLVLLFGVLLVVVASSLSGYFLSAVLVVAASVSAIAGVALLRVHYYIAYMILGTALIFSGAGVIVASNIAFEYLISRVQNTIYVDLGATISACGCVLAAYSIFTLHSHK